MSKTYTAINIQWPISQLILKGEKTIETRTYPIPPRYVGQELLIIETPGKTGKFKARIVGSICFEGSIEYKSKKDFYKDWQRHLVDENSKWAWKKKKWGWKIKKVSAFQKALPAPVKKGIVFTLSVSLKT